MNRTLRQLALGASTGVTVFALVVPLIHLAAALAVFAGVVFSSWDNPVEIFIFLMTAGVAGVFPWGLWIVLTDAREGDLFDEGHGCAGYLLVGIGVFMTLMLLVCTVLQPFYLQFRFYLSPALFLCGVALIHWRWRKVWRFPRRMGVRNVLDCALPSGCVHPAGE